MTNENVEKIEELITDSLDTLTDKKRYSKTMNQIIKDCSKEIGVDKKALKKVNSYYHYKGADWENKNPLKKDKDAKYKDKVSPIFIKLLEVVENLREVGDYEFLKPYLTALEEFGIHITIDETKKSDENKTERIKEVLDSASKLQTNVDTLTEELKEEKSSESEELNFTPKSSFINILGFLDKINEGKNIEDKIQDNFTQLAMLNNAFTYISVKNEENKENDE